MKYLIALLLALVSTCANAGLTYIYFDNETWELEGLTFFEIIGADSEFNIFADPVVGPVVPPPVSNDGNYYRSVGGFINPTSGDPIWIPHTCLIAKARFSDAGDILLWINCREKLFADGFESPLLKQVLSLSEPIQSKWSQPRT